MKKIVSFILFLLLGILYSWSGFILAWTLIHTSVSMSVMNLVMGLTGPLLLIFTIIYFIWKKRGMIPILGLILGFIIGFVLMAVGLTGA